MIDIDEFIGQRKEEYRKLVDAEMTVCVRFFTFLSFVFFLEYPANKISSFLPFIYQYGSRHRMFQII